MQMNGRAAMMNFQVIIDADKWSRSNDEFPSAYMVRCLTATY